ncbi:MAG: hypothetical protein JXA71_20005 [Chitinispirillaceae bacterium]|nr:hypothetical protein [Chitinispirillaceae bacterium]
MNARWSRTVMIPVMFFMGATLLLSVRAQDPGTVSSQVTVQVDTAETNAAADTHLSLPQPVAGDTTATPSPKPAVIAGEKTEGIKLVKRSYNGRQQVFLATGMMIFVVAIMTAAQQWNPR